MITEIRIYRDSHRKWIAEIKDTRPYLNLIAFGTNEVEAEENVKRLHNETLKEMFKKSVTIALKHIEIKDFIQQLLDQRDEEIIGKLSSIKPDGIISLASNTNPDEDVSTQKFQAFEYGYRVAVHQAISTIKETRKK